MQVKNPDRWCGHCGIDIKVSEKNMPVVYKNAFLCKICSPLFVKDKVPSEAKMVEKLSTIKDKTQTKLGDGK